MTWFWGRNRVPVHNDIPTEGGNYDRLAHVHMLRAISIKRVRHCMLSLIGEHAALPGHRIVQGKAEAGQTLHSCSDQRHGDASDLAFVFVSIAATSQDSGEQDSTCKLSVLPATLVRLNV